MNSDPSVPGLRLNHRPDKPRTRGLTEIRGPYYSAIGPRYLEDVFETVGGYVDSLKFAGGSFALMPRSVVKRITGLAHAHRVAVSTGGFMERVLVDGAEAVDGYLRACADLGFDTVELSCGFIALPMEDWEALVRRTHGFGLKAKAEVGIQFGAGGASTAEALESIGAGDPRLMIQKAERLLEAGADSIMIESEGITESVKSWRADIPAQVVAALGLEKVMFEAAEPEVFSWYVRTLGPDVNLFVDHSQIVQLECLRSGLWGTTETWGRIHTYRPPDGEAS